LAANTGARAVPLSQAGYVFGGPQLGASDVFSLQPGTALDPDHGATLILVCDQLLDAEDQSGLAPQGRFLDAMPEPTTDRTAVMLLRGRGIAGRRRLVLDRATASILELLTERDDEYPLGIDLFLADPWGKMVSLPRTTHWSKEGSL
jgi:phosphonate C-P lyase system protein PhnH